MIYISRNYVYFISGSETKLASALRRDESFTVVFDFNIAHLIKLLCSNQGETKFVYLPVSPSKFTSSLHCEK